jgi:hypothetical protein
MCFEQLNLNNIAYATTIDDARLELEENMFGVGGFNSGIFSNINYYKVVFV